MSSKKAIKNFLWRGIRVTRACAFMYKKFIGMESLSDFDKIFYTSRIHSPGQISPRNHVPEHIVKPYYCSQDVKPTPDYFQIKLSKDIDTMRLTCRLASSILEAVGNYITVGITTDELDKYAHYLIIKNSAYPSPLLYHGFPKSICTSVNNVACHGIPDDRKLRNGDIVTVDVTVFRDGFHGDCAATFLVGNVDETARNLVSVAKSALDKGIASCKPGRKLKVIAETITSEAQIYGYSVIPSICGHGIGKDFHEYPEIVHSMFYADESGEDVMLPGMTFTIEPVICEEGEDVYILEDEWTAVSSTDSLCAQFEHTVLITETGVEVLTK